MKQFFFILSLLSLVLMGCSSDAHQGRRIQWKDTLKKERAFERVENTLNEKKEEKRKQISADRLDLLYSNQVKDFLTGIISSVQKGNTPVLLPSVDSLTGTIRRGANIPLYRIGEYYLGLCGGEGSVNHYMCIQSQAIPTTPMDKEQCCLGGKAEHPLETPFYGLIIAKEGDSHRLPLLEVEDIGRYECTYDEGCWNQAYFPYALWIEKGKLLLSVVVIGNGAGSGEGTESVFELTKDGKRELVGCYDFIPDMYGQKGDMTFSSDNYINSVNYISTQTHGFQKYSLEKCNNSVKIV